MAIFAFLLYFFFSPPVGPETTVRQCGYDPDGNFGCVDIVMPDGDDDCLIVMHGDIGYETGGYAYNCD